MFPLLSLYFIDQTLLIFSLSTDTSRTSDSTPTRASSTTATTPPWTSSSAAPASTSPPSTTRTLNSSTATSSSSSAASAPWRKLRPASNGPPRWPCPKPHGSGPSRPTSVEVAIFAFHPAVPVSGQTPAAPPAPPTWLAAHSRRSRRAGTAPTLPHRHHHRR